MAPVGCNGLKRDRSTAWDDEEIVKEAAREFAHRHGTGARRFLSEYAEIADGLGDELSATAWCGHRRRRRTSVAPSEKPLPSPLTHVDETYRFEKRTGHQLAAARRTQGLGGM